MAHLWCWERFTILAWIYTGADSHKYSGRNRPERAPWADEPLILLVRHYADMQILNY